MQENTLRIRGIGIPQWRDAGTNEPFLIRAIAVNLVEMKNLEVQAVMAETDLRHNKHPDLAIVLGIKETQILKVQILPNYRFVVDRGQMLALLSTLTSILNFHDKTPHLFAEWGGKVEWVLDTKHLRIDGPIDMPTRLSPERILGIVERHIANMKACVLINDRILQAEKEIQRSTVIKYLPLPGQVQWSIEERITRIAENEKKLVSAWDGKIVINNGITITVKKPAK